MQLLAWNVLASLYSTCSLLPNNIRDTLAELYFIRVITSDCGEPTLILLTAKIYDRDVA